MTKEKLEQAMRLFVSTDEMRPVFHNPCLQDGYYFATDAHALIQVPESYRLDFTEKEKAPNFHAVLPKALHDPIPINVSELKELILSKTDKINDFKDCHNCDGEGILECDLGHDHDCEYCDGKGELVIVPNVLVPNKRAKYKVFGTHIAYNFLMRMIEACEIIGIEKVNKISGETNRAQYFEANGLYFLIMPLLEDKNDKYIEIDLPGF